MLLWVWAIEGDARLAIVSVSHPIGDIALDQVRRKADNAFEDMVRIITRSLEELSKESKKQI